MIHVITEDEQFVKRITDENGDGAEFTLRRVPPSVRQKFVTTHTKMKSNKIDGREYPDTDWTKVLDAVLDYVIIDWNDEVCGIDGKKVSCDLTSKQALPETIKTAIADACAGSTISTEALKKT